MAPEVGQRAGEGDVVDVVPGGHPVRPVLAPAGHSPEDQLGVARQALVGADTEALHHAWPEAFDQRVGALHEVEQGGGPVGVLEVERDVASPTQRHVGVRLIGRRTAHVLGALDADDLGAHVGEQHRREGAGADPGDLDDLVTGEWT